MVNQGKKVKLQKGSFGSTSINNSSGFNREGSIPWYNSKLVSDLEQLNNTNNDIPVHNELSSSQGKTLH